MIYLQDQTIVYKPTKLQYLIHQDDSRFKILNGGRRLGKTNLIGNEGLKFAIENPNSNCIFLSPIYEQVMNVSNILYSYIPKHMIKKRIETRVESDDRDKKYVNYRDIQLKNFSILKFRTSVKPERVKGEGFDWAAINEAAFTDEKVWFEVVLPALMDRNGKAFLESTPNGKNWFYQEWLKGQDKEQFPEYKSWKFASWEGGFITQEDCELLKKTMPERKYRQEILAEFIDTGSTVFPEHVVEKCIDKNLDYTNYSGEGYLIINEPVKKTYYLVGVDLGQSKDFTVITVFNRNTHCVDAFWRFRYKSYEQVFQAVRSLMEYYKNCEICIDSTGVGKPTTERLENIYGDLVNSYYFTYQSKKELIESLELKLEIGVITLPNIPVLIKELKLFEHELTPGGRLTFNAPQGFHDDCVISLALAVFLYQSYEWEK